MEGWDAKMAQMVRIVDNDTELPTAKMHYLLRTLGQVRAEIQEKSAPFMAIIEAEQAKMAKVIERLNTYDTRIKAGLEECLEMHFEHDNWKFAGTAGTAQIVKPKNRISYDSKGLETLRLSSDQVDRLIGHLRKDVPSKPYLKVKLK